MNTTQQALPHHQQELNRQCLVQLPKHLLKLQPARPAIPQGRGVSASKASASPKGAALYAG